MKSAVQRAVLSSMTMAALVLPLLVATAPNADALVPACTRTGNIQVVNTDTQVPIGYVSRVWNSFGEYVVTTTPADYLSVSVTLGTTVDVTAVNPQNPAFPLVGGIVGFSSTNSNLTPGSLNYAYLGGTTATPPNSPPVAGANAFTSATGIPENIESAIWTIGGDDILVPQWVNTDLSKPATHLVDITGILVLTGDTTAFGAGFGPFSNVALHFVSTSGSCITISTQASAGGPPGTAVHDTATLAGGSSPSGTVTFTLFSDNTCATQVFTSTNVVGAGSATSGNFTPAVGTYFWTAAYSGDTSNNPASSACQAANESVTIVKASPTISTQASAGNLLGAPVRDTATLAGGLSPTGSVTFRLFSDSSCATQVFTSTNALAGTGATSDWSTPVTAGTYYWTAAYSGDASNNPATSACQAPNESVVIAPFTAPPPTQTVTGDFTGPITVGAGQSVLITGARVVGPVTVNPGGSLSVVNSQISRGIAANAPGFLSICGASVSGPTPTPSAALTVTNATVPVRIGDPAAGCAGNRFAGDVNLTSNLAVTFGANTVSGNVNANTNGPGNTVLKANNVFAALACAGNNPAPTNAGQTNTAASKSGQCVGL